MKTGSIKWFSPSKGYGFITDDDGEDLFLHYSGLNPDQDRRLFPGDRVEFEDVDGEKGRKATSVRCIERVRESAGQADGTAEPGDKPAEPGGESAELESAGKEHTHPDPSDSNHDSGENETTNTPAE